MWCASWQQLQDSLPSKLQASAGCLEFTSCPPGGESLSALSTECVGFLCCQHRGLLGWPHLQCCLDHVDSPARLDGALEGLVCLQAHHHLVLLVYVARGERRDGGGCGGVDTQDTLRHAAQLSTAQRREALMILKKWRGTPRGTPGSTGGGHLGDTTCLTCSELCSVTRNVLTISTAVCITLLLTSVPLIGCQAAVPAEHTPNTPQLSCSLLVHDATLGFGRRLPS